MLLARGCTLRWSPSATRDGNGAFEGLEMPTGNHPGAAHFSTVAAENAYRVDQHYRPPDAIDYDGGRRDRLRCEVKGMRVGGTNLALTRGQRWRLSWSFYMPSTLEAATQGFTDIFQMKYVDTRGTSSGSPVFTINLVRREGIEKLVVQAQFAPGLGGFPAVDLAPLRDKWLTTTFDFTMGAGSAGSIRWILTEGTWVIADVDRKGIPTWPGDAARLRPKWGLYRKLGDQTNVQTTYVLYKDLKGYLCR